MSNFCVVILAAGEGKRMKSDTPKVLHEILSRPMINYVVDSARKLSPSRIIVVVGRQRPQVAKVLDRTVTVVYQNRPLGTADAVKAAKNAIPSGVRHVVVLYADTPLIQEKTVRGLYDFHIQKNVSSTVLTTYLDNPKGYGRMLRNDAGQVVGIVEDKDATYQQRAIKEVNTGMYCFKKDDLFEALEFVRPFNKSGEFYLTDVVSWLFRKNRKIDACVADDSTEVLGVNSQRELMDAALCIRQRILAAYSENGVVIIDPVSTFIDETAKIGQGTKVYPFVVIENDVVIGKGCSVGPFCHLREGSVFKDGVSVGNFTEIKNSQLEEGVLMRHLGYIGDTKIGKKVNIGAGTVVANFDGKKKNRTVIKDKAFVGCDSVLIAPVVVGKNAVVGAGSVVTRDHNVPDNATVAGVPARIIKKSKKG